jgi:hypothetical protein
MMNVVVYPGKNYTVRVRIALIVSIPAAVALMVMLLVFFLCKRSTMKKSDVRQWWSVGLLSWRSRQLCVN